MFLNESTIPSSSRFLGEAIGMGEILTDKLNIGRFKDCKIERFKDSKIQNQIKTLFFLNPVIC